MIIEGNIMILGQEVMVDMTIINNMVEMPEALIGKAAHELSTKKKMKKVFIIITIVIIRPLIQVDQTHLLLTEEEFIMEEHMVAKQILEDLDQGQIVKVASIMETEEVVQLEELLAEEVQEHFPKAIVIINLIIEIITEVKVVLEGDPLVQVVKKLIHHQFIKMIQFMEKRKAKVVLKENITKNVVDFMTTEVIAMKKNHLIISIIIQNI